jgi:hypothetical protein
MALTSPGVQVTVIDESFYTPAEPGTTPLIVIATAENKSNAAGTGTAAGTTQANAAKVFKVTSQRELVDTFGVPFFEKTASSTPIHGSERNEYGLLAAYSFLGVSNSAFIMRADVDLNELEPQTTAPGAEPTDGTWWVDTQSTAWGIQEWNAASAQTTGGQKFAAKTPIVLTNDDTSKISNNKPKDSVGVIGDYAVVIETGSIFTEAAKVYYKRNATLLGGDTWVEVGSSDWALSNPTVTGAKITAVVSSANSGDFKINETTVAVVENDTLTNVASTINGLNIDGVVAIVDGSYLKLYADQTAASNGVDADGIINISVAGAATNVDVADIVVGKSYKIKTVGTSTDWATITGEAGPFVVGYEFIAEAADSGGDGTVDIDVAVLSGIGLTAGDYYCPALQQTPHTNVPNFKSTGTTPRPTGSVWIKTTEPNQGARWRVKRWNSATKSWIEYSAPIYSSTHAALYYLDRSGGGVNLAVDTLFIQSNSTEGTPETANFRLWKRAASGNTVITSAVVTGDTFATNNTFFINEFDKGSLSLHGDVEVSFTANGDAEDADLFAAAVNALNLHHVEAVVTVDNKIQLIHKTGGDIRLSDDVGGTIASLFTPYNIVTGVGTANFYEIASGYLASNWKPLAADGFTAAGDPPLAEAQDGQLWYNPNFGEVDIMYHNGNTWVGYRHSTAFSSTDENGPVVSASQPASTYEINGQLWISTADLENFPTMYRWNADASEWQLIDKTDQTTEEGVLFADARWNTDGAAGDATIGELALSNFLDTDAPDPALYPKGMLLWNLRRSGGNVKRYANNYVDLAADNARYDNNNSPAGDVYVAGEGQALYATDRWVTASPNNEDGSGSFGRKAQRALVVQKIKSAIDTSSEARDEERRNFNLIAAPGYPEAYSNLINLNLDRGMTAFVVGDTPLRLPADATSLTAWGTNANGALDNGDTGIVSYDEYSAVYYPNGFTTDLGGANAVVPASHMMLRTIALSDQVSYPWFAPAGTRRGGITNATAVGYIDAATGEFQSVALNEGQRDTLYDLKVNPIPFFVGVGLVAYGQKTRARNASALDRINVARLVVYLRSQLNKLARPYIFEPNDKITRDEIRGAVESLLLELVGLRALYDFAVVCDESNNTNARIDRNELYVDIAIEPTKAVEFIYIPLRIKNTGEI